MSLLTNVAGRLAPYGLWLKVGALVLALLAGTWLGWRLATASNAAEVRGLEQTIGKREALIARKDEALRNAARTFRGISERTQAMKAAAVVAAKTNEAAAEQAREDYDALVDRVSGLGRVLDAAKRRGGAACVAQLEEQLCVPLE